MVIKIETCPTCNQVIVPTGIQLPRVKREIFEAIRRRPNVSAEALRQIIWGADPNGGPSSRTIVHTHVAQMNQLLRPHGLTVRSEAGFYRIKMITAPANRGSSTHGLQG
jgi:hypothetical protein